MAKVVLLVLAMGSFTVPCVAKGLSDAWEMLRTGKRQEARELARTLMAHAGSKEERGEAKLIEALSLDDGEEAMRELESFLAAFTGHPLRWRAHMELGLHDYARGSYWGAAKRFESAHAARPPQREAVRATYWRGLSLYAAGDITRALTSFRSAQADNAGGDLRDQATLGVAQCLRRTGNCSEALSEYVRIVSSYGKSGWLPVALYGAGECLERLQREREAWDMFERLSREFPESFEATLVREKLRSAERERPTEAPTSSFAVQIGAFSDEQNANQLVRSLKGEGVPDLIITKEERGGRTLYIVRYGEFPSKEVAERKAKELSTRFGLSYSIVPK